MMAQPCTFESFVNYLLDFNSISQIMQIKNELDFTMKFKLIHRFPRAEALL